MGRPKIIKFKVRGALEEGFKVGIEAGKFSLTIDEPPELGGAGAGPNPIEALLAALASCFAIATVFHAKIKQVAIEKVEVEVEGVLDIRGFMGEANVRPGLLEISVNATVFSQEPEDKVRELVEFVEKHCPVLDTLVNGTKVISKVSVKKS